MSASIRTRIIKIGNSHGIRIPKILLEQSGLQAEVEIEVQGEQLMIRKASRLRSGWDEAFAKMADRGDDRLLDESGDLTEWEQAEWEW